MPTKTFRELSTEVAQRFLQTVVVVDDGASYGELREPRPSGPLVTPGRAGAPAAETPEDRPTDDAVGNAHSLDAKILADAFARKGLICAILKPTSPNDDSTQVLTLAAGKRADIVVLDWVIYDQPGTLAKSMIAEIMRTDTTPSERLRLIVIYTGATGLGEIVDELKGSLQQAGHTVTDGSNSYVLECGPTRITVYAKSHISSERSVAEEDLPKRIVDDFVDMTSGLVSNVAVDSLAHLRNNTHRLLRRFHHGLDAPYLNHRACLEHTADAEEYVVSLVGDEMGAILEECDVGRNADMSAIRGWFSQSAQPFTYTLNATRSLGNPELLAILDNGLADVSANLSNSQQSNAHEQLTGVFSRSQVPPEQLDRELAMLNLVRRVYSPGNPKLTLGSILEHTLNGSHLGYYLCLQPRCDCRHIIGERGFPFLPLSTPDGGFNIVAQDLQDGFLCLKAEAKPHTLRMFTFGATANSGGAVVAFPGTRDGRNTFWFESVDTQLFYWLGDLKFASAQSIANAVAAQLARVGKNDYEWLRRTAGGGG